MSPKVAKPSTFTASVNPYIFTMCHSHFHQNVANVKGKVNITKIRCPWFKPTLALGAKAQRKNYFFINEDFYFLHSNK